MFDDENNEPWEVDAEALALGRWPALKNALTRGPVRRNLELCVVVEHELGLRPLVTSSDLMPRQPEEIIELLDEYDDEHPHRICRFVPRWNARSHVIHFGGFPTLIRWTGRISIPLNSVRVRGYVGDMRPSRRITQA